MSKLTPFHLAIPVKDLEIMRIFYGKVLGCEEGRSDSQWVDFNFFGHQLVIHQKDSHIPNEKSQSNAVDGHDVPVPHFGIVLEWQDWKNLIIRLRSTKIIFVIDPYIRFEGLPGEQGTMFFYDPEGNALEFKSFKDFQFIFTKNQ